MWIFRGVNDKKLKFHGEVKWKSRCSIWKKELLSSTFFSGKGPIIWSVSILLYIINFLFIVLLGMTVAGVYDVIFLNDPWIPAASYYCLLGSTLCTFITLSLRLFIESLKTNEIRVHSETYLKYSKGVGGVSYTIWW